MKWRKRFFTGGEDVDEITPLYNVKYYHLMSFFIAFHSMMVFLFLLDGSYYSLFFLAVSLVIIFKVGELL